MGNKISCTGNHSVIDNNSVDGTYVPTTSQHHFHHIRDNLNTSGRSFASVSSHQSTYSVSRPWSRVSRRRWKESTLTLPYESSKTAWPVTQLESYFLPEFPVSTSHYNTGGNFEILGDISKGAFGKVYKVHDLDKGTFYALKVLSKSKIINEHLVQQVKNEVQIHRACGHHPFIVSCPQHWQSRKRLYIVSDLVEGGELYNLISTYAPFPLALVKLYVAQIALAIDFLHNAGVIYRDLKPENILLEKDGGHVQLIDFGLAKWLKYGQTTKTICGTLRYMGKFFF